MNKTIGFKVDDERKAQYDEMRRIGLNPGVLLREKFDELVQEYLSTRKSA